MCYDGVALPGSKAGRYVFRKIQAAMRMQSSWFLSGISFYLQHLGGVHVNNDTHGFS